MADGGFTLIELMVVVLIVGILVAIALPRYERSASRARAGIAKSNARSAIAVIDVLEAEKGTAGVTPANLTRQAPDLFADGRGVNDPSTKSNEVSWAYIATNSVTTDPVGANAFVVAVRSSEGQCFMIRDDDGSHRFGSRDLASGEPCLATTAPDRSDFSGEAWGSDVQRQWR